MAKLPPRMVVTVPLGDDAAVIGDCLRALALQQVDARPEILLLLGPASEEAAQVARRLRPVLPCPVHLVEHRVAPACTHGSRKRSHEASRARRHALWKAAMLTDPGDILLSTEACGCVSPDWLEANLAALQAGVDAVFGRAIADPACTMPPTYEDASAALRGRLDRIEALLDPDPHDPWPRHGEETGASVAIRREAFLAAGGVPQVARAEIAALASELRRIDARLRHAPEVLVTLQGGQAGAQVAQASSEPLPVPDPALEPVPDRVRRISARRLLRLAWSRVACRADIVQHLAAELDVPPDRLEGWLALPHFGAAWALVEAGSAALAHRPIPPANLPDHVRMADAMLASLADSTVGRARAGN